MRVKGLKSNIIPTDSLLLFMIYNTLYKNSQCCNNKNDKKLKI